MASRPPTDRSAEALANKLGIGADQVHAVLRARDAAWRRVVRTVRAECSALYTADHACARILAAAPGARGTKGGRRG